MNKLQRIFALLFGLFALAACIPAKAPPQLSATAAPGVVVSGDRYDAGAFRLRLPDGWRAITSAAGEPASVILASPDNCTLIAASAAPMDAPEPSSCADAGVSFRRDSRTVTVSAAPISVSPIAPEAQWDAAQSSFIQVADSVQGGG